MKKKSNLEITVGTNPRNAWSQILNFFLKFKGKKNLTMNGSTGNVDFKLFSISIAEKGVDIDEVCVPSAFLDTREQHIQSLAMREGVYAVAVYQDGFTGFSIHKNIRPVFLDMLKDAGILVSSNGNDELG